jgi:hypothetical protein
MRVIPASLIASPSKEQPFQLDRVFYGIRKTLLSPRASYERMHHLEKRIIYPRLGTVNKQIQGVQQCMLRACYQQTQVSVQIDRR